ncbi:class I SAM-dependent methyltransferase [Methylomonas sp. EFPC1]|uniref:Class I SAM-dependent methyltransferase n=1 Tax=Methylomonas defluvii TaxID=3045149 RepID=A0ABU4UGS2_9GAMM|nr:MULTISPECIES: class I SAM-dependent methyltransferase [unclassified Methylomonas]MDX8128381.1 class I SAM-dependent methyltransferase [Methylomonas sp. OY6]QSA99891.1 class I SAM-dependent methyltransferase [Methylomonas sp. EFPC1]
MSNKEIEHLETISAFYEKGDYMDELMIDREIEIIKRYSAEGKSALEVGCGSGSSTEKLYKIFRDIEVIEPSKKNVALLKNRVSNVKCHELLLEEFSTSRRFDFIFFLNVIEHVEDPVQSLKILADLIRHEGLIFISAPNCMSLNRRAGYKMGVLENYEKMAPKDYEVGHRRLYTVDMLKDHCDKAGLKVLSVKGMYLKPLSEKQMIELGDDAVRAFYSLGEDIPEYCASLLAVATKKYY